MRKSIWTTLCLMILFGSAVSPAFAVVTPSFPSCANPQGSVISAYTDGTHGIVGDPTTYIGRDTVYKLSDDTVTQCFCSTDGSGIQTDWWKASSLTDDQTKVLESEGWVYVPSGNLWGLDEDPYLAKNTAYSCLSGGNSGSSNNSSDNGGSSSSSNSSSNSSNDPGQDNGTGGGGEVLGLAATGNAVQIYTVFALALLFAVIGLSGLRGNKHAKNSR